jgi:ferredoxin
MTVPHFSDTIFSVCSLTLNFPLMADQKPPFKKVPVVDEKACIGCTLCTQICPNVYKIGDDGKSHVFAPEGDSNEKIQESMDSCPVSCISWKE